MKISGHFYCLMPDASSLSVAAAIAEGFDGKVLFRGSIESTPWECAMAPIMVQ